MIALCDSIPLRKITVQDIADHCEINRGTFYYNFSDKQALINWIYHYQITEPLRDIISDTTADLSNDRLSFLSIATMHKYSNFYIQAIKLRGQNDLQSYMLSEVTENWRMLVTRIMKYSYGDSVSHDNDIFYISDYLARGAVSMTVNWAVNGMAEPPEKMATLMDLTATKGLLPAIDFVLNSSN